MASSMVGGIPADREYSGDKYFDFAIPAELNRALPRPNPFDDPDAEPNEEFEEDNSFGGEFSGNLHVVNEHVGRIQGTEGKFGGSDGLDYTDNGSKDTVSCKRRKVGMQHLLFESEPILQSSRHESIQAARHIAKCESINAWRRHAENAANSIPENGRILIDVISGTKHIHESHQLHFANGIYFCSKCVAFKNAKIRALAHPCRNQPADRFMGRQLNRLTAGKYPLSNVPWPSGHAADTTFRVYKLVDGQSLLSADLSPL